MTCSDIFSLLGSLLGSNAAEKTKAEGGGRESICLKELEKSTR